jgi:hypothetical protein
LPSMPEPSAGSPPDVSLSGFTRARFPVTDE